MHRSPVDSYHKDQWRRALLFYLICVWMVERSLWRHCNGHLGSIAVAPVVCMRTSLVCRHGAMWHQSVSPLVGRSMPGRSWKCARTVHNGHWPQHHAPVSAMTSRLNSSKLVLVWQCTIYSGISAHIVQGSFCHWGNHAITLVGAIVWLPQGQWSLISRGNVEIRAMGLLWFYYYLNNADW